MDKSRSQSASLIHCCYCDVLLLLSIPALVVERRRAQGATDVRYKLHHTTTPEPVRSHGGDIHARPALNHERLGPPPAYRRVCKCLEGYLMNRAGTGHIAARTVEARKETNPTGWTHAAGSWWVHAGGHSHTLESGSARLYLDEHELRW